MIEWIRLETEHEEREEASRLVKEYFISKPIAPTILYYDPIYSRTFRSSENSILELLKDYKKYRNDVIERLGN